MATTRTITPRRARAGAAVTLMRYGFLRVPPETLAPDAWLDRFAAIPAALDRINRKR